MRRRMYFLLPDVTSAQQIMKEMLFARIEERHVHVLAKRGTQLLDLPEANVLQKTDIVHGAQLGGAIGAVSGAIGGFLVVLFPPDGVTLQLVTVLIMALLGTFLGIWFASMAASAVPNTKLKAFHQEIENGKLLMIVDVPLGKVTAITELIRSRHPEAVDGGVEPTIPAFP